MSMGCPILDNFLHGGFPPHGVIEVTGEASAGKTQFVLQALFNVCDLTLYSVNVKGDFTDFLWRHGRHGIIFVYGGISPFGDNAFLIINLGRAAIQTVEPDCSRTC